MKLSKGLAATILVIGTTHTVYAAENIFVTSAFDDISDTCEAANKQWAEKGKSGKVCIAGKQNIGSRITHYIDNEHSGTFSVLPSDTRPPTVTNRSQLEGYISTAYWYDSSGKNIRIVMQTSGLGASKLCQSETMQTTIGSPATTEKLSKNDCVNRTYIDKTVGMRFLETDMMNESWDDQRSCLLETKRPVSKEKICKAIGTLEKKDSTIVRFKSLPGETVGTVSASAQTSMGVSSSFTGASISLTMSPGPGSSAPALKMTYGTSRTAGLSWIYENNSNAPYMGSIPNSELVVLDVPVEVFKKAPGRFATFWLASTLWLGNTRSVPVEAFGRFKITNNLTELAGGSPDR